MFMTTDNKQREKYLCNRKYSTVKGSIYTYINCDNKTHLIVYLQVLSYDICIRSREITFYALIL